MSWSGTDAELLWLARHGDPAAAARAVYGRFSEDVNRLVWRVLGADSEHDDVVHQVFVHIIAGLSRVREPDTLPAWMASVCVKTVRSEIRRRRVRRFFHIGSSDIGNVAAPVEDHEARNLLEKVYSVLDALPVDERIAFTLRYIDERPLLEVAEVCDCSLATVKRRIARAEQRFARLANRDPALAERLLRGRGSDEKRGPDVPSRDSSKRPAKESA